MAKRRIAPFGILLLSPQTPVDGGRGMQVFFNPSSICNALSVAIPAQRDLGLRNQGLVFHESLHGYTGKEDRDLKSILLNQIGEYDRRNVIPGEAFSDSASSSCRN